VLASHSSNEKVTFVAEEYQVRMENMFHVQKKGSSKVQFLPK
jgi:hypothetical protein